MANKVSVELSANVKGFVDGMNQASNSAKQYETDQRKVADSAINFKKELGSLRRQVMNLAGGYAKLDQEAKNSAFGKEMKAQLDSAKKSLADMVDMQGDLNQEIKNMASDTRGFDTMIEGLSIVGESASAAFGAIATFTGNTEDAKKAVTVFTTVTSALSAAQKIQNALQMQSNTMLAVTKIQTMAATAAEKARTSAVVGSTAAQKAFNLVAKANPYVLLASAIAAVTAAVWLFVSATNKAESAQDKLKREMHDASVQGQKDAQADVVKLNLLYNKTQDVNLKMEDRLKAVKKIKEEYPAYFKDLSDEAILAGKAADKYKQLANDIIAAAKARAYEKKITQLSEANIDLDDQIKKQEKIIEERKKEQERARKYSGTMPGNTGVGGNLLGEAIATSNAEDTLKDLKRQQDENTESIKAYSKEVVGLTENLNRLEDNKEEKKDKGGGGSTKTEKTEVQELQAEIQKLEDEYVKLGNISTDEANKRREEIRKTIQEDNKRLDQIKLLKEQAQGKLLGGDIDTKNLVPEGERVAFSPAKMIQEAQKGLGPIKIPIDSHPLVELNNQLKKLREELELAPDTTAYQEKLQQIADKEQQIAEFKGETSANKTAKAWNNAANAISMASNALGSMEDPALNIASVVAQAIANIALAYSDALAQDKTMKSTIWGFIAAAAVAMVQMAVSISQIHSATGFATGGIVGGNSFHGDNIVARLNSGEMILNQQQQKNLFNMLDTNTFPQAGGTNVTVQGVIHGTDLLLVQKNTNSVRRRSGTQISF